MQTTTELLMQLAIYQYKYIKNYYITKNLLSNLKNADKAILVINHTHLIKLNNLITHNLHTEEKQLVYKYYDRNDMILLWYDFSLNVLDLEVKEYQYFYDTEYIEMLCDTYRDRIKDDLNFLKAQQKSGFIKIEDDFSIKHLKDYKKDNEDKSANNYRTSSYVKQNKNILTFFLIILDILEIWDEHNHFENMDENDPEEIYQFFDRYFNYDYTEEHQIYLLDFEKRETDEK